MISIGNFRLYLCEKFYRKSMWSIG